MATLIEYALMAGHAYRTTRAELNWMPAPQGWTPFFPVPDPTTPSFPTTAGFEAVSFTNGTEIVISFAGTYDKSAADILADVGLATGYGSAQLLQAAKYYLQVKANAPADTKITFTGHSLGGGLAALMSVFFGESAYTFDQAPFANSAQSPSLIDSGNLLNQIFYTPDVAANLKADLAAIKDVNGNRVYDDNALTGLTNFLQQRKDNGGIPNSALVTDINVQGEFLSSAPATLYDRIGTQADIPDNTTGVSGTDLHSQALLTAYLQSNQTAEANRALNDVTDRLPDLLKMIFDKKLIYSDSNNKDNPQRNVLEDAVGSVRIIRQYLKQITKLGILLMMGASMNAMAGWFGFGGTSWKEEVLLHDGQKIVVERTQKRGGRGEIGQSPIKEHDITFTLPGSSKPIIWKDEYSEDVGHSNFDLVALHILNGTPYIVVSPYGCLAYNKWGRPNPPYVFFKFDGKEWQRIQIAEFPQEFTEINLVINASAHEKEATSLPLVRADAVKEFNSSLPQPEYHTILREPVKPEPCPRYSSGPKAPIPIVPRSSSK